MSGKKYAAALAQVEQGKLYTLGDAVGLLKKLAFAKFDETVEVTMVLGVDPRKADQLVRGTIVLPHGLGKSKKVVVIASGDKQREAQEAGADEVGGDELVDRIKGGYLDFDAVIATPDMMKSVGTLGKVLGPRGLMPNPKTGTVTMDVATAIRETKAGKIEFRVDKTGVIHVPVGKVSFGAEQIVENAHTLIDAVVKAKPATAKGKYVKKVNIAATMSPGILLDAAALTAESRILFDTVFSKCERDEMKTRQQKDSEIEVLRSEFAGSGNAFVVSFQGLTVEKDQQLRRQLREAQLNYRVVKNTLAQRAVENTPLGGLTDQFVGPTAIAYSETDPVALAKVLTKFAKENAQFKFRAGVVEGRVISVRDIEALATLPSKEELISKIMFLINAQAQRLAVALAGTARNLAVVVNEIAKQKA